MAKTTVSAALVSILLSGPALSDDPSDQIRSKLLATPMWVYEWFQPPGQADAHGIAGKVNSGKAWFLEKDGKLIGYLDDGWKCDSEVKLRTDGFEMETCSAGDKRFVRSGDEFKATWGSYTYMIRPAP
jgi:hypothetical protein